MLAAHGFYACHLLAITCSCFHVSKLRGHCAPPCLSLTPYITRLCITTPWCCYVLVLLRLRFRTLFAPQCSILHGFSRLTHGLSCLTHLTLSRLTAILARSPPSSPAHVRSPLTAILARSPPSSPAHVWTPLTAILARSPPSSPAHVRSPILARIGRRHLPGTG